MEGVNMKDWDEKRVSLEISRRSREQDNNQDSRQAWLGCEKKEEVKMGVIARPTVYE